MSHATVLGECPDCAEHIPEYSLLIEYERDGDRERFAECPACENVVHPA